MYFSSHGESPVFLNASFGPVIDLVHFKYTTGRFLRNFFSVVSYHLKNAMRLCHLDRKFEYWRIFDRPGSPHLNGWKEGISRLSLLSKDALFQASFCLVAPYFLRPTTDYYIISTSI